jgi:aspartate aminotransferase-like enzyme
VIATARDKFGITIAEGQDHYKGKMFRIAHLGHYDALDMLTVLSAVELCLYEQKFPLTLGSGVRAAGEYFSKVG